MAKHKTIEVPDENGNILVVTKKERHTYVSLRLPNMLTGRKIGKIQRAKRTLYIVRKRSKHLFLKNNSYGFNYKLLNEAKLFDTINLRDEYNTWVIPVYFILEHGKFMNFLKQGFELQIFVELKQLEKFIVK